MGHQMGRHSEGWLWRWPFASLCLVPTCTLPSIDLTGLGPCLGLSLCVHLEQKRERGRDSSCKGGSQPGWREPRAGLLAACSLPQWKGVGPLAPLSLTASPGMRPLLGTAHSACVWSPTPSPLSLHIPSSQCLFLRMPSVTSRPEVILIPMMLCSCF